MTPATAASGSPGAREIAVVLVSGGMDSLVTAAIAAESYEPAFLHLNYGQRTVNKELSCFRAIADHYKVTRRLEADITHLVKVGGSSLTDRSMAVEKADLTRKGIPTSYVPFRNANFLSVAVSWAEVLRAKKIFIGAVEEDSSGYPDCRAEFYRAFNETIRLGTRPDTDLEILTPVIAMKKSEIIKTGRKLGVPFEMTWSCYQSDDIACGECDSCALRLRGFNEAGLTDPIRYAP